MSWRIECQTEQYLVAGQLNRALDRLGRHVAGDGVVKRDSRESAGLGRHPLAFEVGPQAAQVMTAFAKDVHDVHRHAAGQRERQGLHRRRPGRRSAVEGQPDVPGLAAQHQIVLPDQFEDGRGLFLRRLCHPPIVVGAAPLVKPARARALAR